jgi:polysaccharide pyruvyl transferase WcaK-like protein
LKTLNLALRQRRAPRRPFRDARLRQGSGPGAAPTPALGEVHQAGGTGGGGGAYAPPRSIAIWGHFHGRNLGDDLVVDVIRDAIVDRIPDASVTAISLAPRDTERRHGLPTVPINPRTVDAAAAGAVAPVTPGASARGRVRHFVATIPGARRALHALRTLRAAADEVPFTLQSLVALRDVDEIVVAGSGVLLDKWRGPWEHPLTTFRWALAARLAGTKMLFPSVGAGPVESRLGAFLIRKPIDWACYVSVRDEHSASVLHSIGVVREVPVCPDLGWAHRLAANLRLRGGRDAPLHSARTAPRVGLNVMSHEDPRYCPRGDAHRYRAYLEKMAAFVASLLERGNTVSIFSSQTHADRLAAEDLRELLALRELATHPALEWPIREIETVADLDAAIARCDYVVAARFHSLLLPVLLGIPTVGLAYHPKSRALLAQLGRPDRCLGIDDFTADELLEAFERMREVDGTAERRELLLHAERLRRQVEAQFDALFGDAPEASAGTLSRVAEAGGRNEDVRSAS